MRFIVYSSLILAWLALLAFGSKTPLDYFAASAKPLAALEEADATGYPSKLFMQGFLVSRESYRLSNGKRSKICFMLPHTLGAGQSVKAFLDIGVPASAIGKRIAVVSGGRSAVAHCEQQRCEVAVPVWPTNEDSRLFCMVIETPVTEPVPLHVLQTGLTFYSVRYAVSP